MVLRLFFVLHSYRMVIFTQKLNTCSTIFSLSVLGSFCYSSSLLSRSAPARGKRGFVPFESPTPPLQRLQKGFVLVACYACDEDGTWAAFGGSEKSHSPGQVLPPWVTSTCPPDFGSIAPTSLCRFPAKAGPRGYASVGFSGRATEEVAPGTSCALPSEGLSRRKPKGPFHNRKSAQADTERSRSGVTEKKGSKKHGPLPPAHRASVPTGFL
ncbi:hypothetical protein BREVNS_2065 [Brevinematales bacterium NS]|nr:hypothetical protein BREVNS_2065 [Brevinematales bacterium NS]